MSYREMAVKYAAAATAYETAARDEIPTSRQHLSALNAAKTCAMVSQAYSALAALTPDPKVVRL